LSSALESGLVFEPALSPRFGEGLEKLLAIESRVDHVAGELLDAVVEAWTVPLKMTMAAAIFSSASASSRIQPAYSSTSSGWDRLDGDTQPASSDLDRCSTSCSWLTLTASGESLATALRRAVMSPNAPARRPGTPRVSSRARDDVQFLALVGDDVGPGPLDAVSWPKRYRCAGRRPRRRSGSR